MFDLSGKMALVTGASGGIGGAIARAMHAQGAHVVLSGTREEALAALRHELGERASVAPANLAKRRRGGWPGGGCRGGGGRGARHPGLQRRRHHATA